MAVHTAPAGAASARTGVHQPSARLVPPERPRWPPCGGAWRSGSAPALGAGGPRFDPGRPDPPQAPGGVRMAPPRAQARGCRLPSAPGEHPSGDVRIARAALEAVWSVPSFMHPSGSVSRPVGRSRGRCRSQPRLRWVGRHRSLVPARRTSPEPRRHRRPGADRAMRPWTGSRSSRRRRRIEVAPPDGGGLGCEEEVWPRCARRTTGVRAGTVAVVEGGGEAARARAEGNGDGVVPVRAPPGGVADGDRPTSLWLGWSSSSVGGSACARRRRPADRPRPPGAAGRGPRRRSQPPRPSGSWWGVSSSCRAHSRPFHAGSENGRIGRSGLDAGGYRMHR